METVMLPLATFLTTAMSGSAGSQPLLLTSREKGADDQGKAQGPCVSLSGQRCVLALSCMIVPYALEGQIPPTALYHTRLMS